MKINYETIICPCGSIQQAAVTHKLPWTGKAHECEKCGDWIMESDWKNATTMERDYCIKALQRMVLQLNKSRHLIDHGINISDFEVGYSDMIEDVIAVMLCNRDEAKHERILGDIAQWIYEGMVKVTEYSSNPILEDEEIIVCVETPAMLIDYILNYCN